MILDFNKAVHYVALFQKFVDTPVNGRPSLFRIDSVHQMEISISYYFLLLFDMSQTFLRDTHILPKWLSYEKT
jgi:hypothetical protein